MKKTIRINLFVIIIAVLLSSSAFAQKKEKDKISDQPGIIKEYHEGYLSQVLGFSVPEFFNCSLYDTIANWLGTPYCYSGKNAKGIDCSGFVNMIYRNVYGVLLGGNSVDMFNSVKHLSRKKLKEGDLVFFKIKHHRISHVGLYLGENKFAHSSSSNGVSISDLNDPYYKKYFACGGRVN
jgi:lipoprotein Spr